jgi:formylglycine-generating enzyme required for sulfatase activity
MVVSPAARQCHNLSGPERTPVRTRLIILTALALAALVPAWLSAPGHQPAAVWDDPVTRLRFRLIHPGTFQMGTPPDEPGREAQERQHIVRITKGFYLAETEVTQGLWTRVMGNNPSEFDECGASCPVERISWHDVQHFIARLDQQAGSGYRLPTEAEWELACRAGGLQPFGHRSSLSSRDANIHGNFPYNAPKGVHRRSTTPARKFPPNAFGLYDMQGNVWEWVQDEHCPYPSGQVSDPLRACGSEYRVIRGGSWAFDGASARCGVRYTHRPQDRGYSLGFRLAHD